MRHAATLTILVLFVLTLGACGGEDSGNGSDLAGSQHGTPDLDDIPELAPSSDVPALVDTTGMTEAQLEAKLEEIEELFDAKMEEMRDLTKRMTAGGMKPGMSTKIMQVTADQRALAALITAYDKAIDELDR